MPQKCLTSVGLPRFLSETCMIQMAWKRGQCGGKASISSLYPPFLTCSTQVRKGAATRIQAKKPAMAVTNLGKLADCALSRFDFRHPGVRIPTEEWHYAFMLR